MKKGGVAIGLALTWDGARWPVRSLPSAVQKFLQAKAGPAPIPRKAKLARLLADHQVRELRICWVPRLKGGDDVLCPPFETANGLRLNFRATKWKQFGDVLGVVYTSGI